MPRTTPNKEELQRKLVQYRKQLELIYRIDNIRDNIPDTQELVSNIANLVANSFKIDLCLLGLRDEESGALELKAVDDRAGIFGQLDLNAALELMEEALEVGLTSLLESPPAWQTKGLRHILAAPLIVNGEELGALLLANERTAFSPEDIELLQAVVSQTDSAVVHVRTYHHLQQRNKELETIYKIDRIRDMDLDFHTMLNEVLAELCQVIAAEMGFIMLFDRSGRQLEMKASTEENILAVAENYALIEQAANEAIERAEMIHKQDISYRIRSIICVPLILRDEIIGVFGAVNGPKLEGFDSEDRRLLQAIASQVDTAIFEDQLTLKIRSTFGRYVSPQVVEMMLAQAEEDFLKSRRAMLTVLFSDMRGFTGISERTSPESLIEMLNEHLKAMTEIILTQGGTLDKFVGDEVMALFGAPLAMEDHALRAVRTALEMQRAHQKLMAHWQKEGLEAAPIGIGINTGEMLVGNIGCEKRMDYTVIGDNVNLASRLCGLARGGQILISEATYRLVRQAVAVNQLRPVRVKGKEEPVQIYEVLSLRGGRA
ncbi:MAG: adenylate/guanylate cyclase domain-containing protein [Anaerolineae bacterium]